MKTQLSITGMLEQALASQSALLKLEPNDIIRMALAEWIERREKLATICGSREDPIPQERPLTQAICSSTRCDDRTLYNGILQPHTHKPTCPPLSA